MKVLDYNGLELFKEHIEKLIDDKISTAMGGVDQVIETYEDDDGNWYRLWSSGWCEQGNFGVEGTGSYGTRTITLLVPYKSNKYHITQSCFSSESVFSNANSVNFEELAFRASNLLLDSLTTTSFATASMGYRMWKAEGYIER